MANKAMEAPEEGSALAEASSRSSVKLAGGTREPVSWGRVWHLEAPGTW